MVQGQRASVVDAAEDTEASGDGCVVQREVAAARHAHDAKDIVDAGDGEAVAVDGDGAVDFGQASRADRSEQCHVVQQLNRIGAGVTSGAVTSGQVCIGGGDSVDKQTVRAVDVGLEADGEGVGGWRYIQHERQRQPQDRH